MVDEAFGYVVFAPSIGRLSPLLEGAAANRCVESGLRHGDR